MAEHAPTTDSSSVSLPEALLGPTPRPLPSWARASAFYAATLLAAGAILCPLLLALDGRAWLQVAPLSMIAGGALLLWWHRRMVRVLRWGVPVTARVERVQEFDGPMTVEYSGASAPLAGSGRAAYHGPMKLDAWPQRGDVAFLVVDPARPRWRVVWGFARPAGNAPLPLPRLYRRVAPLVTALVVLAALAAAVLMFLFAVRGAGAP